jgi:S-adenosylmethionine:tRNA ribosyltransferase-isomerase
MKLSNFDFILPEHLVAQQPAPERDNSRMMVVWRNSGKREHCRFRDLPDILGPEHFLAVNTTRVFPARLRASRPGKSEEIEVLLLRELNSCDWSALVKPARKVSIGQKLIMGDLSATVLEKKADGSRILHFESGTDLHAAFERIGEPPTPPYIQRQKGGDFARDRLRYQTIYARHRGSVAAPTAGLHFTEEVFHRLRDRGIPVCELLLHVGYGTFQPVRCDNIEEHRMEPEYFELDDATASKIRSYKKEGRKLIAVGTTTTRCLEFLARENNLSATTGYCSLFIYPGFEFKVLDGLITNFHLPRSTLLMLVCAFAGHELIVDCYREAIANNYRFYSYGDCMLLL